MAINAKWEKIRKASRAVSLAANNGSGVLWFVEKVGVEIGFEPEKFLYKPKV